MISKFFIRPIGFLLFGVGIALGLFLTVTASWADLEAIFYGFDAFGGKPIRSLRCPALMTTSETGRITITIRNPDQKRIEPLLRAQFSAPGPYRQVDTRLSLEPGEKKTFEWTVTSQDIDLGFFVLAKVFVFSAGSLPFQEATCGIFVLDLSAFTGSQVLFGALLLMLVCISAGLSLWQRGQRPLQGRSLEIAWAMRSLSVVVLIGVVSSLLGQLLIATLTLIISVLLISVFIYFAANPRS